MSLLAEVEKPKKEIKKRAPKTVKEKKFMAEYASNGGVGYKAALVAYDIEGKDKINIANQIAIEKLQKLTMDDWFEKAGLTNEVMAQAITVKALTAKKQNQYTGEVEDDHRLQLDSLKFAAQLKGLIKAGDINIQNNTQNNITVKPILAGNSNDLSDDNGNEEVAETEQE